MAKNNNTKGKKSKKKLKSQREYLENKKLTQQAKDEEKISRQIAKNLELEQKLVDRTREAVENIRFELINSLVHDTKLPELEGLTDFRTLYSKPLLAQPEPDEIDQILKIESVCVIQEEAKNDDRVSPEPQKSRLDKIEQPPAFKPWRRKKQAEPILPPDYKEPKMVYKLNHLVPDLANSKFIPPSLSRRKNLTVTVEEQEVSSNKFKSIFDLTSSDSGDDSGKQSQNQTSEVATCESNPPGSKKFITPPNNWSPKSLVRKSLAKKKFKINISEFEDRQISEFHEYFKFLDSNQDGKLSYTDLNRSCQKLNISHRQLSNQSLKNMVEDAMAPINFTIFLNMLGERLYGTDPSDTILEAFRVFDPETTGKIDKTYLSEILQMQGSRFTEEELEEMNKICDDGEENVDYHNLVKLLCYGDVSPE